jgi:hypothetical protein
MEILPQIRKLLEEPFARYTQHIAGGRIGEQHITLYISDKHAFGEVVQYRFEAGLRHLGLSAGCLLSIQKLGAFFFGSLTLGYVSGVDYNPLHAGICEQVIADCFEITPGTIRTSEPKLHERGDSLGFRGFA